MTIKNRLVCFGVFLTSVLTVFGCAATANQPPSRCTEQLVGVHVLYAQFAGAIEATKSDVLGERLTSAEILVRADSMENASKAMLEVLSDVMVSCAGDPEALQMLRGAMEAPQVAITEVAPAMRKAAQR